VVRIEPFDEAEYLESKERSIRRHAEAGVRRGTFAPEQAESGAQAEFAQLLPQGRGTPNVHLCKIVDEPSGDRVGETWYTVRSHGGKVQFFVDWIQIDEPYRRRGLATQAFQRLAEMARAAGADRLALFVHSDNPGAESLYRGLGFRPTGMRLSLDLTAADRPNGATR
jgi:ribosomal protein S18 acetylase RimI-like enzyme